MGGAWVFSVNSKETPSHIRQQNIPSYDSAICS